LVLLALESKGPRLKMNIDLFISSRASLVPVYNKLIQ